MNVPLLDLSPQYESIRAEVDEAVQRVVASQYFILGPEVEGFEAEMADYLGVPHSVGCASGTDALLLPLKALEPRPGDEVIIPSFTFFATAGAVWNAGFTPVFCDIDPVTFNVTGESVASVWTDRTRAVIPVHLFGQMAPMAEINELARERGAVVIEDAAQAIGARQDVGSPGDAEGRSGTGGRQETGGSSSAGTDSGSGERSGQVMAGAAGDAGAFSFFPTKNLGGFGDGGMVTSRDEVLSEKVAKLRVHGGRQMYHHEMVGTNSRLDALQAAVLRVKLPRLPEWTEARRTNACRYHGGLEEVDQVTLPETLQGNYHVYNQYTIRARRRDELREHLTGKGIGSGVYYPVPLHLQECFRELGGREGQLPETERACREVLSLPIFPELGTERIDRVVDEIESFYKE